MTEQRWPNIRKTTWCPLCGHSKAPGRLMCTRCVRGCNDLFGKGEDHLPITTTKHLDHVEVSDRARAAK